MSLTDRQLDYTAAFLGAILVVGLVLVFGTFFNTNPEEPELPAFVLTSYTAYSGMTASDVGECTPGWGSRTIEIVVLTENNGIPIAGENYDVPDTAIPCLSLKGKASSD